MINRITLLLSLLLLQSCIVIRVMQENKNFKKIEIKDKDNYDVVFFGSRKGKVIVNAYVIKGGKKIAGKFILDTGAPTILSDSFVLKNNIKTHKSYQVVETPVEGLIVDKNALKVQNIQLEFAGMQANFHSVKVFPSKKINSMPECTDIDGIIGIDLLKQRNMTIDFEENKITFNDSISAISENGISLPFIQNKFGSPILKLNILNIDDVYMWDMGYNGGFLYQFMNTKIPFTDTSYKAYEYSNMFSSIYSTDTISSYILMKNIESVQGKLFPPTRILLKTNPNLSENRGNIGIAFMSNFINHINWSRHTITLIKNNHPNKSTLREIYVNRNKTGEWVISMIDTSSSWYKEGVRTGHILMEINNVATHKLLETVDACKQDSVINDLMKSTFSIKMTNDK